MMRPGWISCFLWLGWLACWSSGAQSRLAELRCEYLAEPLGIDVPAPRFSWVIESAGRGIRQTAYEILVAGAPEKLTREQADQWRSGKVASAGPGFAVEPPRPLPDRSAARFGLESALDRRPRSE